MNKTKSDDSQKTPPLSEREMLTLRGLCLLRGESLHRWILRRRRDPFNAYAELRGVRNHSKALRFRSEVRKEFSI